MRSNIGLDTTNVRHRLVKRVVDSVYFPFHGQECIIKTTDSATWTVLSAIRRLILSFTFTLCFDFNKLPACFIAVVLGCNVIDSGTPFDCFELSRA